MYSDEALLNEYNRIAALLQNRLDSRATWTPALRAEAQTLRLLVRELRSREPVESPDI